jgi:sodium transport system ATP-binding protein
MIEVVELRKHFGSVEAVRNMSFRAEDGCVTGLLGPNGAGKTTTLRILTGLMSADGGRVRIDGIDAGADRFGVQQRLGVLPDSRGLYPRLTAREHVEYFGRLQGLDNEALSRRYGQLSRSLGLAELGARRAGVLSHGERNRVALARALIHEPQNVLLDEPTNGLDVGGVRTVRAIVADLRARGRCVLFSSHIMQEVSALCDRVVLIARGTVVAAGTPNALREQAGCESLEDAFVALADAGHEENAQ